jgi:hypothetical protein
LVTCTFTNATGAILVNKTAKDASFTGEGDPPLEGVTFQLKQGEDLLATQITGSDGTTCFDRLVPGQTYDVVESAAPAGYAMADPQQVQVTAGATCSDGGTPDELDFENVPLSEIQVQFRSLVAPGVTVASIECALVEGSSSTPVAPVSENGSDDPALDDTDETYTNLLPGTYVCTVVVDP